jgi:hypothetical protein
MRRAESGRAQPGAPAAPELPHPGSGAAVRLPSHPDVLTPEQLAERLDLPVDDVLAALTEHRLPGLHTASGQWRTYWPAVLASIQVDPTTLRTLAIAKLKPGA